MRLGPLIVAAAAGVVALVLGAVAAPEPAPATRPTATAAGWLETGTAGEEPGASERRFVSATRTPAPGVGRPSQPL